MRKACAHSCRVNGTKRPKVAGLANNTHAISAGTGSPACTIQARAPARRIPASAKSGHTWDATVQPIVWILRSDAGNVVEELVTALLQPTIDELDHSKQKSDNEEQDNDRDWIINAGGDACYPIALLHRLED